MDFLKRIIKKVVKYFKEKKRPESLFEKEYWNFEKGERMKLRIGTIKRMKCKLTGRFVKMYFTANGKSENGANGHKGWLCLHRGR